MFTEYFGKKQGNFQENFFPEIVLKIRRFIGFILEQKMYKTVVLKSYEKAEKEFVGRKSRTAVLKHLAEKISFEYKYQVSERTLRDLAKRSKNSTEDININGELLNKLCNYLGYSDYGEYILKNPGDGDSTVSKTGFLQRNKKSIAITLSVLFFLLIMKTCSSGVADSSPCQDGTMAMQWQDSVYVLVAAEIQQIASKKQIPCDENLLQNFKKVNPDCNYPVFNANGSPNLYYGRGISENYEYFNQLGFHPVTGKALRPVTKYIFTKYICVK